MRLIAASLLVVCCVAAYGADVPFNLSWDAPTKRLDGTPATPTDYMVYACDAPIIKKLFADPVTCSGNLQTYPTTDTTIAGIYTTPSSNGWILFRVTARDAAQNESPLSNLATIRYNTLTLTFQPPANFVAPNG